MPSPAPTRAHSRAAAHYALVASYGSKTFDPVATIVLAETESRNLEDMGKGSVRTANRRQIQAALLGVVMAITSGCGPGRQVSLWASNTSDVDHIVRVESHGKSHAYPVPAGEIGVLVQGAGSYTLQLLGEGCEVGQELRYELTNDELMEISDESFGLTNGKRALAAIPSNTPVFPEATLVC